jgi:hypothetical protein
MNDEIDYVTLEQLVEQRPFLTKRWVRSLTTAGTIRRRRLGGKNLYRLGEIDALIVEEPVD